MEKIILSVIIPCYNDGKYLLEAVESVKRYDKENYEVIIINDGSKDQETLDALEDLKKQGCIVINQENKGASSARNNGIKRAKGKYLLLLDADNKIDPEYIEKGIKILDKNPKIGVVYSDVKFFGEENWVRKVPNFDFSLLLAGNYIDTCTIIRKKVWKDVGGFDKELDKSTWEDWIFWIDVYKKGWEFYHISKVLFHYRVKPKSRNKIVENLKIQKKLFDYIGRKYGDNIFEEYRKVFFENETAKNIINNKDEQIHALGDKLDNKNNELDNKNNYISVLNKTLLSIKNSLTWRTVQRFDKIIKPLLMDTGIVRNKRVDKKKVLDIDSRKQKLYDETRKWNRGFINRGKKKEKRKNSSELKPKTNSKKILIACLEFQSMTGMPMYFLHLIKGLRKLGYNIDIVAGEIGGYPTNEVKKLGVRVFNFKDRLDGDYSWMVLSEPITESFYKRFPNIPAINLVHSKYENEEPHPKIPQIRNYLGCRQDVVDFWKPKKGGYWDVLNNPIDFERFKPVKKKNSKYTILSASTFDSLRKAMLLDLIKRAKREDIQVILVGKDHGALRGVEIPLNVKVFSECNDVEKYIAQSDEVAGIYMGRITLEAMAMGKKTLIYDIDGTYKKGIAPKNFKKEYNYENVAKKLVEIMNRKWADIIIPHHNRHDRLKECLDCIPLQNFNIIIVAGSDFAKAINKGAKLAETDTLIFINDDTKFEPSILWKFLEDKRDIVGVTQKKPNGELLTYGLGFKKGNVPVGTVSNKDDVLMPSGAMIKVSKKIFDKLGGFDERYKNGLEDVDFCVRAKAKGYTMGIINDFIIHHEAQSEGRFDFITHNEKIFNKYYGEDYLIDLFKTENKVKNA